MTVNFSSDCCNSIFKFLLIFCHFLLLAVWMAMPTLVPLPRLLPLSSLLPKRPLPHLQEVRCLLGQWLALVAMLRLHHLYLEPMQLHLPPVLHLLLFQLVPPTSQPTRCPPLHLLRPQWSTMPAVICWLLYVWVRAIACACVAYKICLLHNNVCLCYLQTTFNKNATAQTNTVLIDIIHIPGNVHVLFS